MGRDFKSFEAPKIELRDFIALLMPVPPFTVKNEKEIFMAEMRARYEMADLIIKEVR